MPGSIAKRTPAERQAIIDAFKKPPSSESNEAAILEDLKKWMRNRQPVNNDSSASAGSKRRPRPATS